MNAALDRWLGTEVPEFLTSCALNAALLIIALYALTPAN
jgi:hypothetical protein